MSQSQSSHTPTRVLVAEDNKINQKIVKELLRKEGFEATIVANGKEALEQLNLQTFDLLILDYNMPELNGLDTLKAIRAHSDKNISSIKVALFTAEKEGQQIQDMRTYGIDYLLQKPINQAQFSDVLKQLSYSSEKASAPNTFSNMEYLYGITNGNPELMIELMDIFIEEVPDAIKQIKVFYQQGDFPSIQRLTHKLGSNYKYVGAHEAEQLFQSLQTDFNDEGGKQHFAHRIQHLEVITSQIIETLQVEKQKLTGRKKI